MEKILKKANELGHLLKANEIVNRYQDVVKKLEGSDDSRKLMEELANMSQAFEEMEKSGKPIEPDMKKDLAELQEKAKADALIGEFLATQAYYVNILTQVNEAIANPQGEPPKESEIILPGDMDKGIIIS
jgi:cell fate (sporulation/competence/biofilm development) regulator YlbF (YheA/YmcA/DUF963 family)